MIALDIDFTNPKYQDPMEEVYAVRRAISAMYSNDVHRLVEAADDWIDGSDAAGGCFIDLPIARCEPARA